MVRILDMLIEFCHIIYLHTHIALPGICMCLNKGLQTRYYWIESNEIRTELLISSNFDILFLFKSLKLYDENTHFDICA